MSWLSAGTLFLKIAHELLRRAEHKEIGENAIARETLKHTQQALNAIAARDRAFNDPIDADGDGVPDDDGHRID